MHHRLLLLVIACRAILSQPTTTTTAPVDIPDNGGDGGPVVDDGGTGKGQTELSHQQELVNEQNAAEKSGHGKTEEQLMEEQAAYEEWLEECVGSETPPEITDLVSQYLAENEMTEAQLLAECENSRATGKRMINNNAGKWDKCIVPYQFHVDLSEERRNVVKQVHDAFHKNTGFRFVEYNNTNSAMGLGHNNYLIYVDKNTGCWSFVGNLRNKVGQNISPCGSFAVAMHEVGHALGFRHEHIDPSASDILNIRFNNIKSSAYSTYTMKTFEDAYKQEDFYDLTSAMSYGSGSGLRGYGGMMSIYDPELTPLIGSSDYFYMFRDLQEYHDCYAEYTSCSPLPTCQMGGYPSVVNGVCTCACPEYLDPATNCATPKAVVQTTSWPTGTFSLLKVKDGDCPTGTTFGQMARWNHKSTINGGDYHSEGRINGIEIVHDVCTQTTSSGTGVWPSGEYCLLQKGACPEGFTEGLIETFGKIPARSNSSYGALPDGNKGQEFEYKFCCRDDGHWKIPISVPNSKPFIWYLQNKKGCQRVEGMHVFKEFYHSKSNNTDRDLAFDGELPYLYKWNTGSFYTYYCVYHPINTENNCNVVKKFSASETTSTFETPNYPNNYPKNSECFWHFESPSGTAMRLDFSAFEVSTIDDAQCTSYVELKTVEPGMTGFRICGHHEKRSRLTRSNSLTVKFSSSVFSQQTGFSATVTVLSESDQCYVGAGNKTYAGTVDYSQLMKACVPWSQVTHCALNQFSLGTQNVDLSHNYCRRVEQGQMPWCYTNAELCLRENCDACMRDSCYDVLPTCAAIVAADAQFCSSDEHGEASHNCMNTCGFCSSHTQLAAYSTVTCSAPGDVTSISATPVKSSYNVGDVVSYTCSDITRTRTCQGDGTWTHLGYVCSGCPTGWSYIQGRCFQWQGLYTKQKYNDALATCQGLGATLPVVESAEQLDGIMELTNFDKHSNPLIWMGLRHTNGAWAWADGTTLSYTSWDNGQPKNKKCVKSEGAGTWTNNWCGTKLSFVCSRLPAGTFVCEDDLPNCSEVLETTPDMCEKYQNYALVNCRQTCQVSGCPATSNTCSAPEIENAQQVHGSSTPAPGEYVEYECNTGYIHSGGNLMRTCLSTGQFNGNDLVCSDPGDVSSVTLFSDVELFRRNTYADMNLPVVADSDTTRITVAGKITAWSFFSSEAGEVSMLIWRPNANDNTKFTLVGRNTLTVTADNRAVTMQIASDDQITAQVDDVIGLYMKQPVITFDKCDGNTLTQYTTWMRGVQNVGEPSEFTVDEVYDFQDSGKTCRVYSIHVTIAPPSD